MIGTTCEICYQHSFCLTGVAIEEEQKTLKSTLDVDLNLSQHLMSTSQVNISSQHLMSIFQLDFPFLMPSISQYLEFNIYDCYFWVGFPVSAVKYFSKFGILHLRLHFWAGFPISAVKYSSKFKFCIHNCHFWVRFPVSAVKHFSKFGILHLRLPFFRSNSGDHRPPSHQIRSCRRGRGASGLRLSECVCPDIRVFHF